MFQKVEFNFRIILNFNQEGCQGGSVLSLLLVIIQQCLNFLNVDLLIDNNVMSKTVKPSQDQNLHFILSIYFSYPSPYCWTPDPKSAPATLLNTQYYVMLLILDNFKVRCEVSSVCI